jgi:crotonobetainyl-CoA:carnitine CoA-transferase CaiB-like acyl-CoA transferase
MLQNVLSGIKVIDLTQNVAGPFSTQILGDLGADVIKIERPDGGDDTRNWRPPEIAHQSSTFLALNRNKSSVCIDVDTAAGQRLMKELVAGADVFIHSMKPGSAEARGLGFADFKAVNRRLVYCAISAFGQLGPLSGLPGYDPLMQAFTGVMSTTGNEGEAPVRVGVSLIDMGTGMWAALGVLAGLLQRVHTDEGLMVEASLLETGVSWMSVFIAGYVATGRVPKKLGSAMAMTAPYELFKSHDGHVFIAAGNDRLFSRVCQGLGCPDMAFEPMFATNPARVANRSALRARISDATGTRTTAEIVAALRRVGAPCSELNDVSQMLAHEQVEAVEIVAPMPIADGPEHKVVALPLKANGKRSTAMRPSPALGEDTDRVLAQVGYDKTAIMALRALGVVG